MKSRSFLCPALALGWAGLGCGAETQFSQHFDPNFRPANHTISVFGVYKDGQMSSGAWDAMRPKLASWLSGSRCDTAYGPELSQADGRLFTAIDEYSRANGPTDDLLTQLAPAAQGDLILVLVEAGNVPSTDPHKVSVIDTPAPSGLGPQGARGFSMYGRDKHGEPEHEMLQLTAMLFSVGDGRSVAAVDMRYTGQSRDEAMRQFADRLARALPLSVCGGWTWQAKIDADRIRTLGGG